MHEQIRLTILSLVIAACGDGGGGSGAIEVRSVWTMETHNTEVGGELVSSAVDYLRSLDGELGLGLSPLGDWQLASVDDSAGLRHVRVKQTYGGVRVVHGDLVVHADETTFLGMNGMVVANLDGFDTTAAVGEGAAREIAEVERTGGAEVDFAQESSELVILPRDGGGADLAWHVELGSEAAAASTRATGTTMSTRAPVTSCGRSTAPPRWSRAPVPAGISEGRAPGRASSMSSSWTASTA